MKCFNCGKTGHLAHMCRIKKSKKKYDKKPFVDGHYFTISPVNYAPKQSKACAFCLPNHATNEFHELCTNI